MTISTVTSAITLPAFLWLTCSNAFAHPGHEHELTKEQAILRAKAIVTSLVESQKSVSGEKLDESWIEATKNATCRETPELYLISFNNHAAGKDLYLLLSSAGKYLRANFDGVFADLTFSPYPVFDC